jgi:8-oxo-dGTP pyrophosphatase MutT (NUDIX family)
MNFSTELITQLTKLHCCDQEEAKVKKNILSFLSQRNCTSRMNFTPGHLTTSIVPLSPCNEYILLVRHPVFKKWIQPGGHIDQDDHDIFSAALRELEEETSVRPSDRERMLLLDVAHYTIPECPSRSEPTHSHFDLRFLVQLSSMECRAQNEIQKLKWHRRTELSLKDTDKSILRALLKIDGLLELN